MVDEGLEGGWDPFSLTFEAKVDVKRVALEEVVHENEPEFLFRGRKEEWQKFCETTLAKDQKEQDPV